MPVSFMEQRRGDAGGEEVKLNGHKSCQISPGVASLGEGMWGCVHFFFRQPFTGGQGQNVSL